ncbi:QDE-2-interacting protein [Diplocarpon rosae]|nr:QDE-2-interacting protein [Diplocarpon rosae]
MDRFQKLQALSEQGGSGSEPRQNNSYYSDSDSDEHITSGRAARGSGPKPKAEPVSLIYTELGTQTEGSVEHQLKLGQLAPERQSFVPWAALKKYPYTYIGQENRQKVCEGFFDGGKISNEPWEFFYIYRGPSDLNLQPIILVPTKQVEAFLARINRTLNTSLAVPSSGANGTFQVTFTNDGNPQPRYLGSSTQSKMAETLLKNVPPHYYKLDSEPGAVGTPSDRSLAAFRAKIELMTAAQKGKKTANKEKQKKERIEKQQAWHHSIKRVQRYLGLRESNSSRLAAINESLKGKSSGEWNAFDDAVQAALAKLPPSAYFDAGEPAPYTPEGSVVFVCVDVEAYERNTRLITEIGISTLDTLDLISLVPGEGGVEWMKKIRARHFRISDHKHLNNGNFVAGCADRFEFGDSEFVSLKDAPHVVASCFKPPFSKSDETDFDQEQPKRNIVLVGHDVGADIAFLQSIGYDVTNLSNLLEQVDTAVMWRYLKRELNPRNLASILAELGIIGWNLHNAGNDAAYTLQAMVAIAIKHIDDKQKKRGIREKEKRDRIVEYTKRTRSVRDATEAAVAKEEGWSSGGENSDGGAAVPVISQPSKVKKNQAGKRNKPPTHSEDSRGPWKPVPQSEASTTWETNNSSWGSVSQQEEDNDAWEPNPEATTQWDQNAQYRNQWGVQKHINSQWGEPPAAPKPGPSHISAAAPIFKSSHAGSGKPESWRPGSAPTPAPVTSPHLIAGTAKLEKLMKNTSISKEPAPAAGGNMDASRGTKSKPKPKTPENPPKWVILEDNIQK